MSVQLWEKGTIRDTFVATLHVAVPGQAGSPHIDAQPRQYQFTSQTPFRVRTTRGVAPGSTAVPPLHAGAVGMQGLLPAAGPGGDANPQGLVYPAGVLFVRSGWVAEAIEPGTRLEQAAAGGGRPLLVGSGDGDGDGGGSGAMVSYENPLAGGAAGAAAAAADEAEAQRRPLMPPPPHMTVGRLLRRAAERMGVGAATRTQVW